MLPPPGGREEVGGEVDHCRAAGLRKRVRSAGNSKAFFFGIKKGGTAAKERQIAGRRNPRRSERIRGVDWKGRGSGAER